MPDFDHHDHLQGNRMQQPTEPTPSMAADTVPPSKPPRRPGIWSGLCMVLLYLALQVVAAIVLGFVAALGYGLIQRWQGHKVSGATVMNLLHVPDVRTGFIVVVIVVVAAFMLWLIRYCWPAQWRVADPPGFGFVKPESARFSFTRY